MDATPLRALRGGDKTGPTPTDRGRGGTQDHLLTDGGGLPLAMRIPGANRHESTPLLALVDAVPPVAGKPGAPKRKPEAILGDRAFDSQPLREALWARGIVPFLARRGEEHGSGLGGYRRVVERTFAWFKGFRRLRLRFRAHRIYAGSRLRPCSLHHLLSCPVNSFKNKLLALTRLTSHNVCFASSDHKE